MQQCNLLGQQGIQQVGHQGLGPGPCWEAAGTGRWEQVFFDKREKSRCHANIIRLANNDSPTGAFWGCSGAAIDDVAPGTCG
jgi:hypothetical protein